MQTPVLIFNESKSCIEIYFENNKIVIFSCPHKVLHLRIMSSKVELCEK